MQKIIGLLLIPVMALAIVSPAAWGNVKIDARTASVMLDTLDVEMSRRGVYLSRREACIDSLTSIVGSCRDRVDPMTLSYIMELGDLYSGYLTDSALVNYSRGEALALDFGDRDMAMKFKLKRIAGLPLVGLGTKAVNEYEEIPVDSLEPALRMAALEAGRQLYSYQSSFFINYPDEYKYWLDKSIEQQRILLELLPVTSDRYLLNQGEYFFLTGHPSEAKAVLLELLDRVPHDTNVAARASSILGRIAESRGNADEQLYYLARSAVSDIKSATREVVSLQELGMALYDRHEITKAYEYLDVAMHYAVDCNASMRMLQTSEALPVIADAHREVLAENRRWLYIAIGFMALLMVALVVALFKLRAEMRMMKELQHVLAGANHIKEMYMSQFLNLCTIYMNKLNQFCKIAARKISTGHTDELYKMTKSGKFVEEQSQEFYDTFDRDFLHIYPTFVDEVNGLMRSDAQIVLKEGELLNTDLRILAFMRLGVEESTRIAQVLNYSVHTIYAYRNRLKNRAVDRDNFERDVMMIGHIA